MIHARFGLALAISGLLPAAHAINIGGNSPVLTIHTNSVPSNIRTQLEESVNTSLETAFNKTLDDARANLAGFDEQKELAHGFGNANTYATHSGTLSGYQNYSLFAVSGGFLLGFQAPSTDFAYLSKVGDEINEKGDIYAGIGMGVSYLNLGINAGFLLPGLYLNVKYGAMQQDIDDFSLDFSVMGVGANYRILDSKSLAGIVKWRGVSAGTGIYVQSNKLGFQIEGEAISNPVPLRENVVNSAPSGQRAAYEAAMDSLGLTAGNPDVNMNLTPTFEMGLDVTTVTVPLEASTAVSLLFGALNFSIGAGVDLNFGSSEVVLKGVAQAVTESPDEDRVTFSDADVNFDGSSEDGPSFVRPRITATAGLGLGPLKIDVPVLYYPASGAAFGVTVAVVW